MAAILIAVQKKMKRVKLRVGCESAKFMNDTVYFISNHVSIFFVKNFRNNLDSLILIFFFCRAKIYS